MCSATLIGYFLATTWAYSANALAPVTMSLTVVPERNSAPPVDTCRIPSLPASASPRRAALSVMELLRLMAG